MLDDYKSIPFLAGVSLLLLTSVSIGAFVYSSLRSDYTEQSTEKPGETSANKGSSGGSAKQSSSFAAPEASAGGNFDQPSQGIPIGKYSNPPTTIETGSNVDVMPKSNQESINDFESSIERNRAIGRTLNQDSSFPDYSRPSSSNNFNDRQENSLIKPLEENSLLETPSSDRETTPLNSVDEPLSKPLL